MNETLSTELLEGELDPIREELLILADDATDLAEDAFEKLQDPIFEDMEGYHCRTRADKLLDRMDVCARNLFRVVADSRNGCYAHDPWSPLQVRRSKMTLEACAQIELLAVVHLTLENLARLLHSHTEALSKRLGQAAGEGPARFSEPLRSLEHCALDAAFSIAGLQYRARLSRRRLSKAQAA